MHLLRWLDKHDPGRAALRRAGRTAIVMPGMFAFCTQVIANSAMATFAAFGSFAMLLLVGFGGPMRDRLQAQAALAVVGAAFVCLGTLASRNPWLAAAAMTVVGFGVLFAGIVSSVLAGATPSLLLAFILPVSLPGPVSAIGDRLAGWALASVVAFAAVGLLWPAPARDPLRGPASAACRALAARLRADVAYVLGGQAGPAAAAREQAVANAEAAVEALHRGFLATPYRPTGLSTATRTVVRLVDELNWLDAVVVQSGPASAETAVDQAAGAVRSAAALVLERGADSLDGIGTAPDALRAALAVLGEALTEMERSATVELPARHLPARPGPSRVAPGSGSGAGSGSGSPETAGSPGVDVARPGVDRMTGFLTALDPSFRAQELSFVVTQIAMNIDLTAAAERRSWLDRLLGRQPAGLPGTLSAASQRAGAHVERHSVWLHNSVRGAIGLGLAVLVADLSGVQHSFWVVLGTLSVLRSNALNTGQNVVRGLLGTVAGVVVGAALLAVIGVHPTVLWFLLPPAILLAGIAPAAISFAAGQAAFTLVLVILFNIIQPAGWRVGLLRVEDIALGCAVSLAVGLLFWPRGAGAALGRALAEAYQDSARYLANAVEFGMICCDFRPPGSVVPPAPTAEAIRAAAAARRLDDTFRGFLAERGPKRIPLAEVTSLMTGVVGVRLAADAVLDLWRRDDGRAGGDRAGAQRELLASTRALVGWYDGLAASLLGRGEAPAPQPHDELADSRLVEALRRDLTGAAGHGTATAVRMIWTGDHLDAVRRLEAALVEPARTAVRRPPAGASGGFATRLAQVGRRARQPETP